MLRGEAGELEGAPQVEDVAAECRWVAGRLQDLLGRGAEREGDRLDLLGVADRFALPMLEVADVPGRDFAAGERGEFPVGEWSAFAGPVVDVACVESESADQLAQL